MAKKHTESRTENYRALAELRVALIAYVNSLNEFAPAKHIAESVHIHNKLVDLKLDQKQAYVQLRNLADVGLIQVKPVGKDFHYVGKGFNPAIVADKIGTYWKRAVTDELERAPQIDHTWETPPVSVQNEPMAVAQPKPKALKASKIPSIEVDVVKETGRVRLTIQGLIIEIGVVDK